MNKNSKNYTVNMKIREYRIQNKIILILFIAIMILTMLSGCIDKNNDIHTAYNGSEFIYGNSTVENIEIQMLESFPVQVNVIVQGSLPDNCTEIDRIIEFRDENTFYINIKTKRPADVFCTQVIRPFEETITLDVDGLKAGVYEVNVNGVLDSFELTMDNVLP